MKQMQVKKYFAWFLKAGFQSVACHWRLYNFVITSGGVMKLVAAVNDIHLAALYPKGRAISDPALIISNVINN